MNVTPESEVPIIPKATKYQGLWRFPIKKESVSAFRDVRYAIRISNAKYAISTVAMSQGANVLVMGSKFEWLS
ncbi:hypothetical protein D3C86_1852880 [compost metagenome]